MSTRLEQELPAAASVAVLLSTDDPADRLRAIRAAGDQLQAWQRDLVTEARRGGLSWAEISEALGTTEQAAWEAYNRDLLRKLEEVRARVTLSEDEVSALIEEEREALYQARQQ